MTAQLADARERTEESRRAIETTRAYLESILANLSAGVLAFDDAHAAAHREPERGGHPAAAADRRSMAEPLAEWGKRLPVARARSPSSSPRASAARATTSGSARPS